MSAPAPDFAIEVTDLRKTYRSLRRTQVAVDKLSMKVPRHGVHGFLGPNGSGKTTTIRMLLGLIRADSGAMQLLGETVPRQLPDVINRVGAIVESPKFFPNFSAQLNLELAADAIGTPRKQVGVVLEQVGLAPRAKDKFRTYSLGMKQRLAIAGTLLKQPDVLIFDEPTNGLDPAGIQEIREVIKSLGREGRCVLVSSHILSEVEQMADTVTIIGRGRLLAEGSVDEIMGGTGSTVRVLVPDAYRAAGLLLQRGWQVRPAGPALLVDGAPEPSQITRTLADEGLYVSELFPVKRDLESVFLELTQGTQLTGHIAATGAPPPPASAQASTDGGN